MNTPYYMTECGIDGFTRTDSGYALTLPGLPEGELTFTLSEAERPQPPKRSILHLMPTELIIVPAAVLVAVAAVFLPARRKRRTKDRENWTSKNRISSVLPSALMSFLSYFHLAVLLRAAIR